MRVLLIKTSSMGDVIHALPALTDAAQAIPGIEFDWVVEEPFAEIPAWHPSVKSIIPVALRKWRKQLFAPETRQAMSQLRARLRQEKYDVVLDAQGLAKSAFLSLFATGERVGLDFRSAREWPAALAYQKRCKVNFYQHAVVRMRSLFSQALGYALPATPADFGLSHHRDLSGAQEIIFLPATTWASKLWPEEYWIALAEIAVAAGYQVKVSGGSPAELARSARIASAVDGVIALPRSSIGEMAKLLAGAKGVVAVDTGFAHLAAALNTPTVAIYGSTNPEFTGVVGNEALLLAAKFPCAPCYSRECKYTGPSEVKPACYGTLPPELVWNSVLKML